ncbi:hypothetical protein GP644_08145 [Parasedimentitalea maritima]|uniref:Uncharacterized protein n=2 Tax=Parasedimentitalea maritima TaxID=2578117 RepID=A0A6A4RCD5_9RHOB|nr:hypothetical protein GP644_08145 [Zongyanglinia marina]
MTGTAFSIACSLQPLVGQDPVIHVLAQFPALILAGALLGGRFRLPQHFTGPSLVLALVSLAIWMLPRSLDAALLDPVWMVAKFVTLPLCVGLPLAAAWSHVGSVLRGFLKAQAISMLLFLGFLYTHAPMRLCNSYLVDDQQRLGLGFVYVACALILWWIIPVFFGQISSNKKDDDNDVSRHGIELR